MKSKLKTQSRQGLNLINANLPDCSKTSNLLFGNLSVLRKVREATPIEDLETLLHGWAEHKARNFSFTSFLVARSI